MWGALGAVVLALVLGSLLSYALVNVSADPVACVPCCAAKLPGGPGCRRALCLLYGAVLAGGCGR